MTAERTAEDKMDSVLSWIKRGPRILVAAFAFMSGAAGVAAWLGAQASSPSQRIGRLELRVDTGFMMLDTLESRLQRSSFIAAQQTEKLDLLLRLGCPTITRADLIRDCRELGAIR